MVRDARIEDRGDHKVLRKHSSVYFNKRTFAETHTVIIFTERRRLVDHTHAAVVGDVVVGEDTERSVLQMCGIAIAMGIMYE